MGGQMAALPSIGSRRTSNHKCERKLQDKHMSWSWMGTAHTTLPTSWSSVEQTILKFMGTHHIALMHCKASMSSVLQRWRNAGKKKSTLSKPSINMGSTKKTSVRSGEEPTWRCSQKKMSSRHLQPQGFGPLIQMLLCQSKWSQLRQPRHAQPSHYHRVVRHEP